MIYYDLRLVVYCCVKATIVSIKDGMILLDPGFITIIKIYD